MQSRALTNSTLSVSLFTLLVLTGAGFANEEPMEERTPVDEVLTQMICLGERVVQGSQSLAEESSELKDLQARTHQEMVEYIQKNGYDRDIDVELAYRNHENRGQVRESILKSSEESCQPGSRVLDYLNYIESEDYVSQ